MNISKENCNIYPNIGTMYVLKIVDTHFCCIVTNIQLMWHIATLTRMRDRTLLLCIIVNRLHAWFTNTRKSFTCVLFYSYYLSSARRVVKKQSVRKMNIWLRIYFTCVILKIIRQRLNDKLFMCTYSSQTKPFLFLSWSLIVQLLRCQNN